ncbi:unnamed protein product [Prunus brigantina]
MHNLELLLLDNVKVSGDYEDFPKKLIWLCWRGFPLKSIPEKFYLENLVGLDLRNSSLQHVWKGTRFLLGLKILNLSHSHSLVTTPDLSGVPNLEKLILKDCINLVVIDESLGNLEELIFLNLKDCRSLMKLPTRICMLRSLQELDLSGCSKLVLHTSTTAANHLHSTTRVRKKLNMLSEKIWQSIWSWRSWVSTRNKLELASLSMEIWPHCLGTLSLADCNLSEIPGDLSILSLLKHLNISRNPILRLPEKMNGLIMLQTLEIQGCAKLRTLPKLPQSLRKLHASYCTSLERIMNLPNMFESLDSSLWKCKKLVEVQSLFDIKPLKRVDIEMIRDMGLFNLESTGVGTEVEMTNYLTYTTRNGPLQGLYECGIFSIFVHGNKIPDRFTYRSVGKSWTYCPVAAGLPKKNQDMLWLSHWRFENDELEEGEQVHVSINEEFSFWAKEFCIQLVYEKDPSNSEDIIIQQETPPSSQIAAAGNVSASASKYQFWANTFYVTIGLVFININSLGGRRTHLILNITSPRRIPFITYLIKMFILRTIIPSIRKNLRLLHSFYL